MSGGLGGIALASLLDEQLLSAVNAAPMSSLGVINPLHFKPRAKRIIWLYQAGGPSHLESFDHKPKLRAMNGRPMPESFTRGQPIAQLQGRALTCMEPQHPFERFGKSGQELATIFPQMGKIADDICIIKSMTTEAINHDPAHAFMNTGTTIAGRPAMGSWLQYGLGTESQDLPGFIVMVSTGKGGQMQPIASRQWHSGFLPSKYQGVRFQSEGDPVHHLSNPPGVTDDPEIATRISQYEMAFKMQSSVPRVMDISDETTETMKLYGVDRIDGSFAANCLLARRLAERGVRFIQLCHRDWDHHGKVKRDMAVNAGEVDRASAALIMDLKRRGLLEDTIVLWGGEFGRTPMAQGDGRDHHIKGFSLWVAGGGFRGGISHGATDELGYNAVTDVVRVHDLHATMLHLLGIEHTRLTYRFQGRDFRLTDVHGELVKKILA